MIVDRRNITKEEMKTNVPAPTLVMFDMEGNIYVAETNWGRRVQRFNLVSE